MLITLLFANHASYTHFTSPEAWAYMAAVTGLALTFFFVLSGFLITNLLIREDKQTGSISLPRFYLRRALRILPPAFLYLLVLVIVAQFDPAIELSRAELAGATFFFRNLQHASEFTAHYYSLAIEEQFYLFWPLVLILIPRSWRLKAALFLCLLAPVWRQVNIIGFGVQEVNWARFDLRYDALLTGAVLAFAVQSSTLLDQLRRVVGNGRLMLVMCLTVVIATTLPPQGTPGLVLAFLPSFQLVAIGTVIFILTEGLVPSVRWFLALAPVVWIGTRTYSLYLWQQLFFVHPPNLWIFTFPWNFIAAVLAGAVAFRVAEHPAQIHRAAIERWVFSRRKRLRRPAANV